MKKTNPLNMNLVLINLRLLTDIDYIPCLYLPYAEGSDKILIFFHGNAEDIGWSLGFVAAIQEELGVIRN